MRIQVYYLRANNFDASECFEQLVNAASSSSCLLPWASDGERYSALSAARLLARAVLATRTRVLHLLETCFSVLLRKSSAISRMILGGGRLHRTPKTILEASLCDGWRFIRFWILARRSRGMRTSTQQGSPFAPVHCSYIDRNGSHDLVWLELYAFRGNESMSASDERVRS